MPAYRLSFTASDGHGTIEVSIVFKEGSIKKALKESWRKIRQIAAMSVVVINPGIEFGAMKHGEFIPKRVLLPRATIMPRMGRG